MPVQEEPEDLSMKPLSSRRSSEVSDYNHVTEDRHSRSPSELNYTHVKEENHEVGINGRIKMECSSWRDAVHRLLVVFKMEIQNRVVFHGMVVLY